MKVVLFCGGMGMRLRENDESLPKPLVRIGYMPILWHVMRYYAHFGHKDFILCLGYKADAIKSYFLNYNECLSNDFVLSNGVRNLQIINNDIQEWTITFADTGMNTLIGQRLKSVEKYLDGEDMFLANYSDGLTDLPLPDLVEFAKARNTIASFLSVRPNLTYHFVRSGSDGIVTDIHDVQSSQIRINGGFYVFKRDIFRYINNGEELVHGPFQTLVAESQLSAFEYNGFWASMDTFKDKQHLDEMYARGQAPWEVWKQTIPARTTVHHAA